MQIAHEHSSSGGGNGFVLIEAGWFVSGEEERERDGEREIGVKGSWLGCRNRRSENRLHMCMYEDSLPM